MDDVTTKTRVKRTRTKKSDVDLTVAITKESPIIPPVIPEPPKLTMQEDTFALAVIEYAGNVGAAYRAAFGADQEYAAAKGKQLLGNPLVQERINGIMSKIQDSNLISLGAHLAELADIRDTAKVTGQIKVALDAERSRGEAGGLYAKHNAAKAADLSNAVVINVMSPDQLMQHANRKMGVVTDVTAKEVL
jgi:hypothetical protein